MINPDSEQAFEYFNDNLEEIFGSYIQADKVTDEEIMDIVISDDLIFSNVMDAWLKVKGNEEALRDWYMQSLPDGNEDNGKEDR